MDIGANVFPPASAIEASIGKNVLQMARFSLATAAIVAALAATPATAQTPSVVLPLTPALVAEIARLIDLQPIDKTAPAAFWELQTTIDEALRANPDAFRAVATARSAAR